MRTTINLPDDLLAQIKKLAAASHSTVTALIGDALREALAKRRHKRQNGRVTFPTYGKKGLHPDVDLDDGAALLDLMKPRLGPSRRYCSIEEMRPCVCITLPIREKF